LSKIILANPTQSAMTVESLGDDLLMFSSRARRTAAMIDAAMTSVDAKRSFILDAGIDPAFAFAFRKTGFLLTEENMQFMTSAELAEWNDAIEEYRSNEGRMQ
jgi:hypothetical protein